MQGVPYTGAEMSEAIDHDIELATDQFMAGRLQEAWTACRRVLDAKPLHAQALHLAGLISYQLDRAAEALDYLDQAIAVNPADPSVHNSRGSIFYQLGRYAEAEPAFRQAITHGGDLVDPHINLGNALFAQGRPADAEACFRTAIGLAPGNAGAHNNLGTALRAQGRGDDAVAAFRQALLLRPTDLEARYNLGDALLAQMQLEESEACFRYVITHQPRFVPAHAGLGQTLYHQHRIDEAIEVLDRAAAQAPDHPVLDYARRLAYGLRVPAGYPTMLTDQRRNDAFDAAIARAVAVNDLVLEIGTGSGLFALMAARAGAGHVITCENNQVLARVAGEIVARNSLADRIAVVPTISTRLRVGIDLKRRADVLIFELVTPGFLAPNALTYLKHAKAELLRLEASIIPRAITVHAVLVESETVKRRHPMGEVKGFDLAPFDRLCQPGAARIDLASEPHRRLSAAFAALTLDFRQPIALEGSRTDSVPVTADGLCHGVAFWLVLHLDDTTDYTSAPDDHPGTHLKQALHIFPEPRPLRAGDLLTVTARYDNTRLVFEPDG